MTEEQCYDIGYADGYNRLPPSLSHQNTPSMYAIYCKAYLVGVREKDRDEMAIYHNYLLVAGNTVYDREDTYLGFQHMTEEGAQEAFINRIIGTFPHIKEEDIKIRAVFSSEAPIVLLLNP